MSTDKEFVLQTMRDTGLSQAQRIQAEAPDMTGTELYAEAQYIPDFHGRCDRQEHAGADGRLRVPVPRWAAGEADPAL